MLRAPALALCALAGALVILPTQGSARPPAHGHMGPGVGSANPSGLVAVEMAEARIAREKGLWRALRDYADEEAVFFVPEPVLAQDWLKGREEPAGLYTWQAHKIWMSCDGSLGITQGAWQRNDGATGAYTTIWKRQKKGDFRWVLTKNETLSQPLSEPDMLSAIVADCGSPYGRPAPDGAIVVEGKAAGPINSGRSQDGSLIWSYRVNADNTRSITASLRKNGQMQPLFPLAAANE